MLYETTRTVARSRHIARDHGYIVMQQPRNLGSLPQPMREPDGALTVFDTEGQALDAARMCRTRELDCWTAHVVAWPHGYE